MEIQNKKKLDFSGESIYVGLDVHKKSWKVTIMTACGEHKTFTQAPQATKLTSYLRRMFPQGTYYCAYEAGFSGFWACRQLQASGVHCMIINPADVPTGDKEKRRKSDAVDSRKIARSLRNQELSGIYLPSIEQQEDRSLLRTRTALVKDVARCKNRIKSFLFFHGVCLPPCYDKPNLWSRSFVSWLQGVRMQTEGGRQSILLLIRHLQESRSILLDATRKARSLSRTAQYTEQAKYLQSIPGVGTLTSMILLTELGDIKRFKIWMHYALMSA